MTGNKSWSSVKLGQKNISTIYKGETIVWISVSKYWRRKDIWKRKELW